MRRLQLWGRENIAKRALIHAGGFNLGVLMRRFHGMSKPRALCGRVGRAFCVLWEWLWGVWAIVMGLGELRDAIIQADRRALHLRVA